MRRRSICLLLTSLAVAAPAAAASHDWFVGPGGRGTGSAAAPFGRIQDALDAAAAGDTIVIASGTYDESLATPHAGTRERPITIRAAGTRSSVLVTARGRVLTATQPYLVFDGLVFDGQYGPDDTVRVATAATGFTLRQCEVRHSSRDAIDIGSTEDVLIDHCSIHHALDARGGRRDAHGIVGSAVHRLTVRDTEIHTFSGDGIQFDPDRAAPGWSDVLIENCRIWLAPLPAAENGFPAGTVPGENAIDTKASAGLPRAHITVRNVEAWGFEGGLIRNMAAFNLKEHIDAVLDRITVHDSEIAFRVRGLPGGAGARVRIQNAVIYEAATAIRYEDDVQNLRVWHVTMGRRVGRPFRAALADASRLDVRNSLFLAERLPREAAGRSNLAVPASAFVDAGANDYHLAPGSSAIDAGQQLAAVPEDRDGTGRPQGRASDVGAYERGAPRAGPDAGRHERPLRRSKSSARATSGRRSPPHFPIATAHTARRKFMVP